MPPELLRATAGEHDGQTAEETAPRYRETEAMGIRASILPCDGCGVLLDFAVSRENQVAQMR
jgi:hypothetical protein